MLTPVFTIALATMATAQVFHKATLAEDYKNPYQYVHEQLDMIGEAARSGLQTNPYEVVEESEDYPDNIEAAASVLNTVGGYNVAPIALNQGLAYGGLGGIGLGQGIGLGLGGVGALGGLGGNVVANGVGLVNQGIGGLGVGGLGLNGGLIYHPILGAQVQGGYVDKKAYEEAQKKGADQNLEKLEKKVEEEAKHGHEGFHTGAAAAKAEKGDSSYYKDEEAKKKAAGDEKYYEGGQKFDKHGINEEVLKKAKSHKKGHVSKGYKTSSSKNEEEKHESYYDEAHDEGDHHIAGQNAGSFGENSHHGFKGAHEEKVLDANAAGKEGHHHSVQKIDDAKGNKGEFAEKGYKHGAEVLEKFNNLGAHSIHGHQEATGIHQQNKGILPIHRR